MTPIEIVDARPEWPSQFQAIAAGLRAAFGLAALRIDHIGSTAVPGLAAKDRIDVQVTVRSIEPPAAHIAALEATGLRVVVGVVDHRPPGATGPDSDWAKLLGTARPRGSGSGSHGSETGTELPGRNVHVRADGRPNARYALLCRDYLRAERAAAESYAQIKRALAAHAPDDEDFYYAIKDPVFDLLMAAAERWAASTGWSPGPSDA